MFRTKNPSRTNYSSIFSSKVQNLTVFNYLHDSNSIFRVGWMKSENVQGCTVRVLLVLLLLSTYSTLVVLVTCPTLCPLQFLLITLLIGTHKCEPHTTLIPWMKISICNVIFMRMISPSVKHTPLEFERFGLLFSLSQRESPFSQGSRPASFWHCNFLRWCLGGGDASLCIARLAGSTGIFSFFLGTLNNGVKCSTLAGGQSWIFLGWCAAFILGFSVSHCCFVFCWAQLDIDDNTSGRIISGLDVTCVLVSLPSTHESPWCGPLFRMRNLGAPLQLSERVLLPSLFPKSSMPLCKLPNLFFYFSRRQCFFFSEELGMMALSVHTLVLWTCHGGDNEMLHTYSRNLPLLPMASRSASAKSATPPSSCKESLLAHCQGSPLASPEVEAPPASKVLTLSWREVWLCADLLVLGNHLREDMWIYK